MKNARVVVALALLAVSVGLVPAPTAGQEFPNRPLRYIVPFPPGGSTDIMARIVAAALAERLGQSVVIDNRGGAGGTVGAEIAANATPDGYNIFACNIASLAVSPAIYRKLNYDPVNAFTPIGFIGSTPNAIVVHPSLPAKTIPEYIALAKSRAGKLNYGSPGIGTSPQLTMEMFKNAAGIDVLHVAFKGAGPALAATMGGQVDGMVSTLPTFLATTRAGKIRMLAITALTRSPDVPDVPTLAESGFPGFQVISWQGLCTPAGSPKAAVARLRATLAEVLALPDTRKRLAAQGINPGTLTAEQFAKFIRSERDKFAKAVKDAGVPQQ
ncbi:MAG TPA: tripartite tricarboxylate transporter substrate binding protein [Burkholderiales bacterium]|nr:tripartite tricarboxylate transporter substrate binding protein [Burkholderiales bacterium]